MALMDLVVKLRADSAQFKSGLASGAAASKSFANNVEQNNSRLIGSFKALGAAVAAAYAAKKVIDFAGIMIEKANAQEKAMAKLEAVITATGGAAGYTAAEMAAYAAQLQKTTTYGDENIIVMQSMLATFKGISGEIFQRTTRAVLDLSTTMEQDLKSSAVQLGKALEDPIRGISALSRVGVTFTKDERDMITWLVDANKKIKAQEIILQALEGQVKGSAEALRGTFGGAVAAAKNSWGDFLEQIGMFATESEGLISAIESINSALETMSGWLKTIRTGPSIADYLASELPAGFLRELFLSEPALPEKTIGAPGAPAMTFSKTAGPAATVVDPERFGMSPELISEQMQNLETWSTGFHEIYARTLNSEVEKQTWKKKFDAANNFYDALEARSHMWAETNGGIWQQVANSTVNIFDQMVKGFGDAVAQALVYGEDLGDMMKSLGKQILATVISSGIQIGIMSMFGMPIGGTGLLGAFHGGGTVPESGPYLLQRGETVRTQGQERNLLKNEKTAMRPIIIQLNGRELGRAMVDLRADGLMHHNGNTMSLMPV